MSTAIPRRSRRPREGPRQAKRAFRHRDPLARNRRRRRSHPGGSDSATLGAIETRRKIASRGVKSNRWALPKKRRAVQGDDDLKKPASTVSSAAPDRETEKKIRRRGSGVVERGPAYEVWAGGGRPGFLGRPPPVHAEWASLHNPTALRIRQRAVEVTLLGQSARTVGPLDHPRTSHVGRATSTKQPTFPLARHGACSSRSSVRLESKPRAGRQEDGDRKAPWAPRGAAAGARRRCRTVPDGGRRLNGDGARVRE